MKKINQLLIKIITYIFLINIFSVSIYADTGGVTASGTQIYANGTPIVIKADENNETWIYNYDETNKLVKIGDEITTVYGGSDTNYVESTSIIMKSGTVKNLVGGGRGSDDSNNADTTYVKIEGGEITDRVFAGGFRGGVDKATLIISGGKVKNAFGGGFYGTVNNAEVAVNAGANIELLFGGGLNSVASVTTVDMTVSGGIINDKLFGGGYEAATSNVNITMTDGTVDNLFGGSYNSSDVISSSNIEINGGIIATTLYGAGYSELTTVDKSKIQLGNSSIGYVYGGSYLGKSNEIDITIDGSSTYNVIIAGGDKESAEAGKAKITLKNGTVNWLYGGGNKADVRESEILVDGNNANILTLYGGGKDINSSVTDTRTHFENGSIRTIFAGGEYGNVIDTFVDIKSEKDIVSVYGGGYDSHTQNSKVQLNSDIVVTQICGGGCLGDSDSSEIIINDGEVINVVAGGMNEEKITSSSKVEINGGFIKNTYIGNADKIDMIVEGGSILKQRISSPVNLVGEDVYKTTVTVGNPPLTEQKITWESTQEAEVDSKKWNSKTDEGGNIYAYLPEKETNISVAKFDDDSIKYIGKITADSYGFAKTTLYDSNVKFYDVTFGVKSGNGLIALRFDDMAFYESGPKTVKVPQDKSIVFQAMPNAGYTIEKWYINGKEIDYNDLIYTVENIKEDITVEIEYAEINLDDGTYFVCFSPVGNNGTLSATANNEPIVSGAVVSGSSIVAFDAKPNKDYKVKEWMYNGNYCNEGQTELVIENLDENITVYVFFDEVSSGLLPGEHIVSIDPSIVGGQVGIVTTSSSITTQSAIIANVVTGSAIVKSGDIVKVEVAPDDNMRLVKNSLRYNNIVIEDYQFIMPEEDVFITAKFEDKNTPKRTVSANISGGGEITGLGEYDTGEIVTLRAVAYANYDFSSWEIPLEVEIINMGAYFMSFYMPPTDLVINAKFNSNAVLPPDDGNDDEADTDNDNKEDNKEKEHDFGKLSSEVINGENHFLLDIDILKITRYINQLESGDEIVIKLEEASKDDILDVKLNIDIIDLIAKKINSLVIETSDMIYELPVKEIDKNRIVQELNHKENDGEIALIIRLGKTSDIDIDTSSLMDAPCEVKVTASNNHKTVEINKFQNFVKLFIKLDNSINGKNISTAALIDKDKTDNNLSHVIWDVVKINGKNYLRVYSLYTGIYAPVEAEKTFEDIQGHFKQDIIEKYANSLIIKGVDKSSFAPNREITKAEFLAVLMRTLGIKEGRDDAFEDVSKDEWFYGYVSCAYEYGFIKGNLDKKFLPNEVLTLENALIIIDRVKEKFNIFKEQEADEYKRDGNMLRYESIVFMEQFLNLR